jgi:hypothetical protein
LYETLDFVGGRSLGMAVIVWTPQKTAGELLRRLRNFGQKSGGRGGIDVEIVSGGDYAGLCRSIELQIEKSRGGVMAVTIVSNTDSCVESFRAWLTDRGIITEEQIAETEGQCRAQVDKDRRDAYIAAMLTSDNNVAERKTRRLMNIRESMRKSVYPPMEMPAERGSRMVTRAMGVARCGIVPIVETTAEEIATLTGADYAKEAFVIRTLDEQVLNALDMIPGDIEVYAPATRKEAGQIYEKIFTAGRRAIVVETGSVEAEDESVASEGRAAVRLSVGEDLTIVSTGSMTAVARDTVKILADNRVNVEAIHIVQLRPAEWTEIVGESVRKTKRLVVLTEKGQSGVATEIVSTLATRSITMKYLVQPVEVIDNRNVSKRIMQIVSER